MGIVVQWYSLDDILRGFACGLKILMGIVPSLIVASTFMIFQWNIVPRISSLVTLPLSILPVIFVMDRGQVR